MDFYIHNMIYVNFTVSNLVCTVRIDFQHPVSAPVSADWERVLSQQHTVKYNIIQYAFIYLL